MAKLIAVWKVSAVEIVMLLTTLLPLPTVRVEKAADAASEAGLVTVRVAWALAV